jgi:hypothetical protein
LSPFLHGVNNHRHSALLVLPRRKCPNAPHATGTDDTNP